MIVVIRNQTRRTRLFGQSNNGDSNKNDSKVSKPLGFGKSEKGVFASKSFGSQSTTESNAGEGKNVKNLLNKWWNFNWGFK